MPHNTSCTLLDVTVGETVFVQALAGDRATCAKLNSLGFTPGTEVTLCPVCASSGGRRFVLRNCPVVLDEQTAASILCTRSSSTLGVPVARCCAKQKGRGFGRGCGNMRVVR